MYTRISTFLIKPGTRQQAADLANELKPEIMKLPGIRQWIYAVGEDEKGVVVAVYDDADAAKSASEAALALFGRFAKFMATPPEAHEYEVENNEFND
jgi:quinol monooxygenase YgiN